MSKLQSPRGTHDLFAEDQQKFDHINALAKKISQDFGFSQVSTPIFEFSGVFQKTLGDTSDIVSKEMYEFKDRGGESLTLRPEGTAGIARAFISNGLTRNIPLKWFYAGPMFRYERPQKGRTRQFHQIGVELIGAKDYKSDIDVITLSYHFLKELGLYDKGNTVLELNSIGDNESRQNFRKKLVDYFTPLKTELSEDSKTRLDVNPLRILDSKDPGDQKLIEAAPTLAESMNDESKHFYDNIKNTLQSLNIPFEENSNLVRGLDYYSHCVFEYKNSDIGAQSTILAGGRYDHLIKMMGGPEIPGVGWAAGVERLMLSSDFQGETKPPVAIITIAENSEPVGIQLCYKLREQKVQAEIIDSGNMSKRFKKADKLGAKYAVIIGDDELKSNNYCLKDLSKGEQETIDITSLISKLKF